LFGGRNAICAFEFSELLPLGHIWESIADLLVIAVKH